MVLLSTPSALKQFKVIDRQKIIAQALAELSPLKKIFLAIMTLCLLTPLFLVLAFIDGWLMLPLLLIAGLGYPILTRPLELQFAKPHLNDAIEQFQKQQQ